MVTTRKRAREEESGTKNARTERSQHHHAGRAPAVQGAPAPSTAPSKQGKPATTAPHASTRKLRKDATYTTTEANQVAASGPTGTGHARSASAGSAGCSGAAADTVTINRAPVLTLWAAVVAERQGFSWGEGLTFGRLISGILAQSKGRALGIYEEREHSEAEREQRRRQEEEMGVQRVEVFGMRCPAVKVGDERRAVSDGKPIEPDGVQGYLERAFGNRLEDAKAALEDLAAAIPPSRVGRAAYQLYERFRPEWKGWGQKGSMSLGTIRGLARTWQQEA